MFLSTLFNKKSGFDSEICIVIDVGSSSVGGAVVVIAPNKKPRIIYSIRIPISIQKTLDPKKLTDAMFGYMNETLEHVSQNGIKHLNFLDIPNKRIDNVFCVFSSPWYVSMTKEIKIEKKDPVVFSKQFVENILKSETDEFEKAVESGRYTHLPSTDVDIMEHKIIQTLLNGYETHSPYSKKAKKLDISLYVSVASKDILNRTREIIFTHIHPKHVHFNTFSLLSYSTIIDLYPQNGSFLYIDVTGEVTDISIIRNNVILETVSFPRGRNYIIRNIAEEIGVIPDMGLSFLKLHTEQHAEDGLSKKIDSIIEQSRAEWCKYFSEALSHISTTVTLPDKAYVTIDDSASPIFMKYIDSHEVIGVNGEKKKIIPILLDQKKLNPFCEFKNISKMDPFLAIESIFLNKIFNSNR